MRATFNHIRTSAVNRDAVATLTRRFGLAAENVIARVAIALSLQAGARFSPLEVKDSGGKEYTRGVLFGNLYPIYAAMMCRHYGIAPGDKDLPRYFKLHLDDGLERMMRDMEDNPNLVGYDYLLDKIHLGLEDICQDPAT